MNWDGEAEKRPFVFIAPSGAVLMHRYENRVSENRRKAEHLADLAIQCSEEQKEIRMHCCS